MQTSPRSGASPRLLRLVVCAMLVAADVVLARFASVQVWDKRIGFAFVAVAVAAYLYGPLAAALVHGLSDALGALLFPFGPYFPGYTVTAAAIGLLYGLCFYRSTKVWRIALGVLSAQLVGSLLLNTLWLSITNHAPFIALLPGRLTQAAILAPVQLVVLPLILLAVQRGARPLLRQQS